MAVWLSPCGQGLDGDNLGTFDSREAAEKHEREAQYFKRRRGRSPEIFKVRKKSPPRAVQTRSGIAALRTGPSTAGT
ncbi:MULTISPECIES: hypothetical protein [unclassified Mesorhizobium]|uniref:hypothetical protein n=1 Tax=unclassified Mesorhizobium TaxID=325217 RepID=UPI0003CE3CB0|nr:MULTISPECIES: hypothetical protein [unclassified Mesorhizobium]ESX12982.1 hypothetical protein X767_30585 [Mesorhizobium sp. LSJC264A00]WJI43595.1 hypothetical protein NL532_23585 [Mesorhizobium sp. C120A]WJI51529.1 hypothetical protein NLY44_02045 [Mesorhizobium sp. C089B]WJI68481.1 hypothetical protein NLY36_27475 [Mesorhizobium sp. C399B]WJI79938.1 hypothetical protein NLY34_24235 [Mesorhizobium sp. C374B]